MKFFPRWHHWPYLMSVLFLLSCSTKIEDCDMIFIGDSIISRWNIFSVFCAYNPDNRGKGGSGIQYIEGWAGKFAGKTVVTHFGTNDLENMENINSYADRYLRAVQALGCNRAYILSVLPHANKEGVHVCDARAVIERLNATLEARSKDYEYIFVDVYHSLLDDNGYFSMQYTEDGIHPNEAGYRVIEEELLTYLQKQN